MRPARAKATAETRENYIKQTMDFTRYLTTLLAHQRLQRTHLQAQRDLVQFRFNLYRALGGSWRLSPPPRARLTGRPRPVEPSPGWEAEKPPRPNDRKGHNDVNE